MHTLYSWKLLSNKKWVHTQSSYPGVSSSVWHFWKGGCSNCCQGDNSSKGGLLYGNGMTGLGVRRWGLKEWFFLSWQPHPRGKENKLKHGGKMVKKHIRAWSLLANSPLMLSLPQQGGLEPIPASTGWWQETCWTRWKFSSVDNNHAHFRTEKQTEGSSEITVIQAPIKTSISRCGVQFGQPSCLLPAFLG